MAVNYNLIYNYVAMIDVRYINIVLFALSILYFIIQIQNAYIFPFITVTLHAFAQSKPKQHLWQID